MFRLQIIKSILRNVYKPLQLRIMYPLATFSTVSDRKILNVWDLKKNLYVEISDALSCTYTCRQIANLLKENIHQITDYQVSYAIFKIWEDDLEIDDHFYNVILPIVKEFVRLMGREHNKSLAELIQYMGWMKIQDDNLWQLFEQKLVNERLYRYIPLKELCKVMNAISEANRGSVELFGIFERVLIKHRYNLEDDDIELAQKAFAKRPETNQLLLDVLDNSSKELPNEVKIAQKKIEENH